MKCAAAFVVLVLLTLIGSAWAALVYSVSGTAIVDSNLDIFLHRLTEQEGDAIVRAFQRVILSIMMPLVVINVLWLVAFYTCCQRDGSDPDEGPKRDPNPQAEKGSRSE